MEIISVDCPKCGSNIPEEVRQGKIFKCNHCGSTLVWPGSQSKLVLSFGTRLCPLCGIDNEQNRNYCRNCGAALTKTCYKCKTTFYIGDNYCPNGHFYEVRLCPHCGVDNEQDRDNCKNCGISLIKTCYLCGANFFIGDNFCPNGHKYEYGKQKIEPHLRRSESFAKEGKLEQAANALEEALRINPSWASKIAGIPYQTQLVQTEPVSGYALLVHLAGKAENRTLAIQCVKRMLELSPEKPGNARQAAREVRVEREAKEIAKAMGITWHWWE